jgi:hypothetical protein
VAKKKQPVTLTEVKLESQEGATLPETTPETPETPETTPETPETTPALKAAIARVEGNYDALRSATDEKRTMTFQCWEGILHVGEATAADYANALTVVKAARAATDAIVKLDKGAKAMTATAALCRVILSVLSHVTEFKGRTPRVVVSFDVAACQAAVALPANVKADGTVDAHKALKSLVKFSVAEGQAKRGRKAGSGKVSSNSRMSAWKAAQDATKAGCEFAKRFKKDKDGNGYRDMKAGIGGIGRFIPAKKDGGLVTYIFALAKSDPNIAKSALVKKLAPYNAEKATEAGLAHLLTD